MRRLFPEPAGEVDPYDAYGDVPASWLRVGMVTSADGSATDEDGWTDRLGGAADFQVFRTLRALSDGIVVGASTVRTGRMGPHRLSAELRARRDRPPAAMVVVSHSLDLDWTLPVFTEARTPTLVVTCAKSARSGVPYGVRTVIAGEASVDLAEATRQLRDRFGLRHLICEGGPVLAAAFLATDLVDELCLTVAPTLLGDRHRTGLLGTLPGRREMRLSAVYTGDDALFVRYRLERSRGTTPPAG